jgi:hypothetical protein
MAAKKVEAPAPEVIEPEAPAPAEEPLNAVIIVKEVNPDGSIATKVALNGDVNALEAQTLIEFGLKAWRDQVGLSD